MKKICLDAGHYGKYNRSPAIKTYYESEMNWKLHNLLKKELESYGFEVIVTRTNQAKDLSLIKRGNAAKGCVLFLSIHSNAVGSKVNESVDYPVAYVSINGKGDKLGKMLADCVSDVMGTKQGGRAESKKGTWGNYDWYTAIKGAVDVGVVGIILEHSFHTNTKSTKWLMNDDNLAKMAKAEAKIIAEYYGMKKTESKPVTEKTTEKTMIVNTTSSSLNVRASASSISKKIGLLANGEKVTVTGTSGSWSKIKFGGGVGYVSSKYLAACKTSTSQSSSTSTTNKPTLKNGSRGDAVKELQTILNKKGYSCGTADGVFGSKTVKAVKAFQKDNKLTADGIVGKNTWAKLV